MTDEELGRVISGCLAASISGSLEQLNSPAITRNIPAPIFNRFVEIANICAAITNSLIEDLNDGD